MMRRSRRISYLTQSYETNSGQEKGEFCCGGHPHIPRQGLRPCNPLPSFTHQTSSPVADSHCCDIIPIQSRYALILNTYRRSDRAL